MSQSASRRLGFGGDKRLQTAAQFKSVFSRPQRSVDDAFMILIKKNKHSCSRLGLAIARKHARRAVDRNRIKRIVRESFRLSSATLPACDLVVLNRKQTHQFDNIRLFASLQQHWIKIQQLCEKS